MRIKERYIPENSSAVINGDACVYTYNRGDKLFAIAYSGKRNKPDFHFQFVSVDSRDKRIESYFASKKASLEFKVKQKAEQKIAREKLKQSLKIGDILVNSWGYEQTNVNYYQITDVKGSYVFLREIASNITSRPGYSPMSGFSLPIPNEFIGEVFKKRIAGNGVSFNHGGCSLFDGKENYVSWYA